MLADDETRRRIQTIRDAEEAARRAEQQRLALEAQR